MAILGLIVLLVFATYLAICAYGVSMLEMSMSGQFPFSGMMIGVASLASYYAAYYFSPISVAISFK